MLRFGRQGRIWSYGGWSRTGLGIAPGKPAFASPAGADCSPEATNAQQGSSYGPCPIVRRRTAARVLCNGPQRPLSLFPLSRTFPGGVIGEQVHSPRGRFLLASGFPGFCPAWRRRPGSPSRRATDVVYSKLQSSSVFRVSPRRVVLCGTEASQPTQPHDVRFKTTRGEIGVSGVGTAGRKEVEGPREHRTASAVAGGRAKGATPVIVRYRRGVAYWHGGRIRYDPPKRAAEAGQSERRQTIPGGGDSVGGEEQRCATATEARRVGTATAGESHRAVAGAGHCDWRRLIRRGSAGSRQVPTGAGVSRGP